MMDGATRDELVMLLKGNCPLKRHHQRFGGSCWYFGHSGTCRDCVYDWITVVHRVGDAVRVRKTRYERELVKRRQLDAKLSAIEGLLSDVQSLGGEFFKVMCAIGDWKGESGEAGNVEEGLVDERGEGAQGKEGR